MINYNSIIMLDIVRVDLTCFIKTVRTIIIIYSDHHLTKLIISEIWVPRKFALYGIDFIRIVNRAAGYSCRLLSDHLILVNIVIAH